MRTVNEVLISAGDMSGNLTSIALLLDQDIGFAITAICTGSPVGTFKLQGSTDHGAVVPNTAPAVDSASWNDISGSSQSISASGNVTWNFNGVFYKWVRVIYTASSGSGSVTATANAKGF